MDNVLGDALAVEDSQSGSPYAERSVSMQREQMK